MKRTSPDTTALIQQLYRSASLWEKLKGSSGDAPILTEIGESNEPAAILDILPFIFATNAHVAAAAANAVYKLGLSTTTKDLVWLDYVLRERSPSADSLYEWHKLSPEQLVLLERFGKVSGSLFGLASFHKNGFVREAAIKQLDLIRSGAELPFLLLRLNDWVANVRDAAYESIRSRLKPEYARYLIANFGLVLRLEDAGRADHKPLLQAINELLQSAECRPALNESLKSEDRFIRRAAFGLALNSTRPDLADVVTHALDEKDTVIRVWAAQRVSSAFEGAVLDHFVELMKRDRFMPVRREALRIAVRRNSPATLTELRSALLDSHPSMREEARYHLRKLDPIDVAAFYRKHLLAGEGITLYAAISGLGETGTAEDDHLIVPYISHPAGRIRRAAIRALAKLNRGGHFGLLIEALKDQVSYVSRQALNALANKPSAVNSEQVWGLFESAAHPHVKRNALSLIEELGKWESIYYLVRAVRDSDEAIADLSRSGIQRWLNKFNSSFTSPTSDQLARLGHALEECGQYLDESTLEELRFSMKGFN